VLWLLPTGTVASGRITRVMVDTATFLRNAGAGAARTVPSG
jgi:hypothetical protein